MIKADLSAFRSSLEEVKLKMTRGLESVVKGFIYDITVQAIDNTPYGTDNELYHMKSRLYAGLYPEPGHAKGGWQVVTGQFLTGSSTGLRKTYPARSEQASDVKDYADVARSKYRLGETVLVVNNIPYMANEGFTLPWMESIESGYSKKASKGVMAPTISQIETIYKNNLLDYYVEQWGLNAIID